MNLLNAYSDGTITLADALLVSVKGIVVVMLILAFLAVLVMILSKLIQLFSPKSKEKEKVKTPVASPSAQPKKTDDSSGEVKLYNTDEKTAAVIMAIVSKESGIPLNRLKFNSIKLTDGKEDIK